ncbi:MAG: ATP-dependent helicase [Nocardiopsaceae bacterium]|nr:ATP-dependent helicase [Nocardiopsaceae bacterium]
MSAGKKAEPTEEQVRARDAFTSGNDLAVVAGAGTGKTSTLVMMAAATRARGLYMAFNRAARSDAQQRFGPNVECRTAHSIAYAAVGRAYAERLGAARIPTARTARLLGITGDLDVDGARITRFHQARLVMNMVRRFCYSNDTEPMARHMEPVNGLNPAATDYVAVAMTRYAERAWDDLRATSGRLRFEHDHYMKIWAMTRPVLPGDFIMLDEAQDTNPVLEAIFLAQAAQRICVGDPAQQIYAWRAARDVMTGFPARQARLTRSFRFGPAIAEVANRWLRHAGSDMRLAGAGPGDSRVTRTRSPDALNAPDAVLCRGNADVMHEVLGFLEAGVPVAITGGGAALRKLAEAARELKAGQPTSHPELFLFPDWASVQEYAENDSSAHDLKSLVDLVDSYGAETIIGAVDRLSREEEATVTVSTAHKAKGREWGSVRIGPGFGPPSADDDGVQHPLSAAEARLIYVAVTRARKTLDITGLGWADDYEKAIAPAGGGMAGGVPLIDLPLTAQLRYPEAPVSAFLMENLPGTWRVVRDYQKRIGNLPHPVQPSDVRYPAWAALGHAIDFRLRLSLGRPPGNSVTRGIAAVGATGPLRGAPPAAARGALHECGAALMARVEEYLAAPGGIGDDYLARLCFVAAFYEDVYRTGEVRRYSMLASATPATTLDELVAAVPGYVPEDIGRQMEISDEAFARFRSLPSRAVACGPEFAGSRDIGGADADFILGGLLLDCKATIMPRKLGADEVRQLAGYLLLDYSDEYGIREVGLYLSRQGAVISWEVPGFLAMLGATASLPVLRQKLRWFLGSRGRPGSLSEFRTGKRVRDGHGSDRNSDNEVRE